MVPARASAPRVNPAVMGERGAAPVEPSRLRKLRPPALQHGRL